MSTSYSVARTIDAPISRVWGLLTDLQLDGRRGATEFHMSEVFSGLLAPLITRTIPDLTEAFDQFADGLKQAAEAGDAGS
jgi:hypothetical protein